MILKVVILNTIGPKILKNAKKNRILPFEIWIIKKYALFYSNCAFFKLKTMSEIT